MGVGFISVVSRETTIYPNLNGLYQEYILLAVLIGICELPEKCAEEKIGESEHFYDPVHRSAGLT